MSYSSYYIKNIEKELKEKKEPKKQLQKLKSHKRALKLLEVLKESYPYIISTGVITTVFALLGGTPLLRDDRNLPLETKEVLDSLGNNKSILTYTKEVKHHGYISHVSAWIKTDETYERTIKKYSTEKINNEIVKKVINDETSITNLEEMFGKPIREEKETRKTLTEEEFNAPEYIEATIYSVDKNDVIKVKEPVWENVMITGLWVIASAWSSYLVSELRDDLTGYSYSTEIEEINDKYENDVIALKRRIECGTHQNKKKK